MPETPSEKRTMPKRIKVGDVYEITGVGLVVATMGDLELEKRGFEYGDYPVELRRPDGTEQVTLARVQAIFLSPAPDDLDGMPSVVVLPDLDKADVPAGSVIERNA